MSVYRRFATELLPCFVTTNTCDRRRLFSSAAACDLLVRIIYEVRTEIGYQLLAFTVMPDHVHLVLVPPEGRLGQIVQLIKGRFARFYNQRANRSGAVWQSRYHERTLRTETALLRALEYVHHNPVVVGLVSEPEDYRWSSANGTYVTDLGGYFGQAEA